MYKPVFCISQDIGQTATIVNNLKMAGFSNNEISILVPGTSKATESGMNYKNHTGEAIDVTTESRADLEWIVGIDGLEIPGIGPFIAAGPIMVELKRTPKKGIPNDLMSALKGVGIPEHEAKHYQEKIKSGRTLIAVNTGSIEARNTANTIFQQAKANDICSSEEASAIV